MLLWLARTSIQNRKNWPRSPKSPPHSATATATPFLLSTHLRRLICHRFGMRNILGSLFERQADRGTLFDHPTLRRQIGFREPFAWARAVSELVRGPACLRDFASLARSGRVHRATRGRARGARVFRSLVVRRCDATPPARAGWELRGPGGETLPHLSPYSPEPGGVQVFLERCAAPPARDRAPCPTPSWRQLGRGHPWRYTRRSTH